MLEYQRRSGITPTPIKEKPVLTIENIDYWAAFLDLNKNVITYSEINAYAELAGLNKVELLVKINAIMDGLSDANNSGTSSSDKV